MTREIFNKIAQEYLTLRNKGDLSEARTIAHNALLDAMTAAGVAYEDREHAARIAAEIIERPEYYEELTKGKTMLIIDSEFQALIPALTPEEFTGLEQNILTYGCRVPLDVWGEILIDGHNRYAICQKHGLPFETKAIQLASRYEAINWIINNQLGRRNVTEEQKSYLRGKRYEAEKSIQGTNNQYSQKNAKSEKDHFDPFHSETTAQRIANEFNISAPTIKRDAKFAEAVDLIAAIAPEEKTAILSGKSEMTKQEIQQIAEIPAQARKEISAIVVLQTEEYIEDEVNRLTQERVKQELTRLSEKKTHVSNNSGNNEWYTPKEFIDAARRVLGTIDLDPASSELANKTVQAATFYDEQENGLTHVWRGRVWMNPPYASDLIKLFCAKYAKHVTNEEISAGIVLVNNATETAWFAELVEVSTAVIFPKSRIKFIDMAGNPTGAPLQGQAILYAGSSPEKFLQEFNGFGWGARI